MLRQLRLDSNAAIRPEHHTLPLTESKFAAVRSGGVSRPGCPAVSWTKGLGGGLDIAIMQECIESVLRKDDTGGWLLPAFSACMY